MLKRHLGVLPAIFAAGLLTTCCCVALTVSSFAQTPTDTSIRLTGNQEAQRIIERSNNYFQSGEVNFKDGNYDRARREYDRAIDIVLESGLDIRSDSRLQQHYAGLIDKIYQRQMTLLSAAPPVAANEAQLAQNTSGPQDPAQKPQEKSQEKPTSERGFGQQAFTPSPLDEVTKLKLTEAETKGASTAEVESAITAAKLDFNFKPNGLVQSFINYYTGRGRATMEQGLRRSGRFMALARKIFKEEGVPQDIAWLGQVESAWSPVARSWAAAVGLWQFIPGTGARYGLAQNYYVDERSSFEKATRASARYLKWLANRYDGNWELAMAAYNSGEGRIDGAIARSGYADFWEIYSRGLIPQETRNYVPNILATIIIAKNPEKYGFSVKPEPSLAYDFVKVNNMTDLRLVADATDAPHDYLLALNPELKRGVTPPGVEHLIRVPAGKGRLLQQALLRVPAEKRTIWRMMTAQADDTFETLSRKTGVSAAAIEQVNGGTLKVGQKTIIPINGALRNVVFSPSRSGAASVATPVTAVGGPAKMITYKVKAGEVLGDIAGRYNTSVRDIATLNRINPSAKLRAGQVLKVPVRR